MITLVIKKKLKFCDFSLNWNRSVWLKSESLFFDHIFKLPWQKCIGSYIYNNALINDFYIIKLRRYLHHLGDELMMMMERRRRNEMNLNRKGLSVLPKWVNNHMIFGWRACKSIDEMWTNVFVFNFDSKSVR